MRIEERGCEEGPSKWMGHQSGSKLGNSPKGRNGKHFLWLPHCIGCKCRRNAKVKSEVVRSQARGSDQGGEEGQWISQSTARLRKCI